jgi:hypothetical protein
LIKGVGVLSSVAVLAGLLTACGGHAPGPAIQYETGRRAAVTVDGLHRVKARRIGSAYLRPGANFVGYDQLLVAPVSVFYKRKPRTTGGGRGNFALEPHEMERFRTAFQEALESELAKSPSFTLVKEPSPDTLRITGHIVDLVVNTPPEKGRDRVYVAVSGEMTLILDVADSQSLEPIGRLAERREVQPAGGALRRSGVAEFAEVRRIFRTWSKVLREGLEELVTLGPIPPLDEASAD